MNIKDLLFKKLPVPATNDLKEVDAVQLWEVRWQSRTGLYATDVRPQMEGFTSEQLATDFADALRAANKLLCHTGEGLGVTVRRVL